MAKTREYMDYLDETIGIAPAYSEEEYQASETLAGIIREHGIETSVEEFEGRGSGDMVRNALVIVLFITLLLAGILGDTLHVILLLVAIVCAGLLVFTHFVRDLFEELGSARRSQNVVAVRRAQAEEIVRGSRPIVIVAHYDSPRESILRRGALAHYRPLLGQVAAFCPAVVAVTLVFQIALFLPDTFRTFMWVVGLVATVPALFVAVCTIVSSFGNCTLGSNDNKASVAALLSMVDKASPADDRVSAAAADAPAFDRRPVRRASVEPKVTPRKTEIIEEVHGVRHGEDVLRGLGILPESCVITYEEPRVTVVEEPVAEQLSVADDAIDRADDQYDEEDRADDRVFDYGEETDETYEDSYEDDYAYESDTDEQDDGYFDDDDAYDEDAYDDEDNEEGMKPRMGMLSRLRNLPMLRGDNGGEEDEESSEGYDDEYTDGDEYYEDEMYDDGSYDEEPYEDQDDGGPADDMTDDAEQEFDEEEDYAYDDESYEEEDDSGDYNYDEDEPMGSSIGAWFSQRIEAIRARFASGERDDDEWIDEDDDVERDEEELDTSSEYDEDLDDEDETESDDSYVMDEDLQEDATESPAYEDEYLDDENEDYFEDEDAAYEQKTERGESRAARLPMIEDVQDDPDAAADMAFDAELEEDYAADFEYDEEYEYAFESENSSAMPELNVGEAEAPEEEDRGVVDSKQVETPDDADEGFLYEDDAYEEGSYEDELYESDAYDDSSDASADVFEDYAEDDGDFLYEDEPYADSDEDLALDEYAEDDEVPYVEEYDGHDDEQLDDGKHSGGTSIVGRILGLFRGGSRSNAKTRDAGYSDDDYAYESGPYDDGEYVREYDQDEYYLEDEDGAYDEVVGEPAVSRQYESAPDELQDYDASYADEGYEDEYLEDYDEQYDEQYDDGYEELGDGINEEEEALPDPNRLHFDREEDDDIVARDDSGINTISDSYDLYARDVERESRRIRPAAIEDPTWGTSTYQPARPAMNIARRAALYDLPDPSGATVDPLDEDFGYEDDHGYEYEEEVQATPNHTVSGGGRGGFWNDDAGNARADSWKGGAAIRDDLRDEEEGMFDGELKDAMLELGDEFLDEHDIWFVATGASGAGHAGIKAFLEAHRRDIRGAFLINLECVGAGELAVYGREGLRNRRKADRRLVRMILDVARDLHIGVDTANCDWTETDAASAMRSRVRAVSIVGLDADNLPALSQTADDVPENVNPNQVEDVVRIVTEVIRRA